MASVSKFSVLTRNGKTFVFPQIVRNHKVGFRLMTWRSYSRTTDLASSNVRIGCASGFWGDTAVSVPQLIHKGKLDFLVFDYLSEITMSLLSAAQQKLPDMGYAPDFVQVALGPHLKAIKKNGVRVISNAGGINPISCAVALKEAAKKADVDLKIAVVTGDNIMEKKADLAAMGVKDIDSGLAFPPTVTSMTTYLGAGSIVEALNNGADIVVTGRCTDSALVLAPLMHSFKWKPDDFDLLASGSLAGHLIECGAQATGGIFTDWHLVPDWHNMGFPIVECQENGEFILTKPPNTGGLVSRATASEQLVYEIGDPQSYILPDVVCDFSQVQMEEIAENTVRIKGAKGKPPTDHYKVSSTYMDGYRLMAVCATGGIQAAAKARRTAEAIITRTREVFKMLKMDDYSKVHIQVLGAEDTYGDQATPEMCREAVLWMGVHHKNKKALGVLAREIAPAGTGMAPGLTAIVGGRPKPSPVLKLFSFLYPKDKVQTQIHFDGKTTDIELPKVPTQNHQDIKPSQSSSVDQSSLPVGNHTYRLEQLAYARSGDKGNHCNIGVIARDPSFLPYIKAALTPEAVDSYMGQVFDDRTGSVDSRIQRYDLPGIDAINLMLLNSLGGGGIASLRSDPQGKAFAQMLLDFKIENVPKLV